MDPKFSLQDVLRCHFCDTPMPNMYCDNCHLDICEPCLEAHFSDKTKEHNVVLLKNRIYRHKCQKHSFEQCKLHCEQCDIPLCVYCVSSGEHEQHKIVDVLANLESKREVSETTVHELEKTLEPEKQETRLIVLELTPGQLESTFDEQMKIDRHRKTIIIQITCFIVCLFIASTLCFVFSSQGSSSDQLFLFNRTFCLPKCPHICATFSFEIQEKDVVYFLEDETKNDKGTYDNKDYGKKKNFFTM